MQQGGSIYALAQNLSPKLFVRASQACITQHSDAKRDTSVLLKRRLVGTSLSKYTLCWATYKKTGELLLIRLSVIVSNMSFADI